MVLVNFCPDTMIQPLPRRIQRVLESTILIFDKEILSN
jgi:hypothetical protein